MTDELKPVRCGCGGEAKVEWANGYDPFAEKRKPNLWYGVICKKCKIQTKSYYTEAEAIEAWNRAMSGSAKKSSTVERIAKVIHCIDCAYWMDKCVYLNDGRIRKYADGENYVGADVGINEGAKCLYDENHGVHLGGYAIFRQSYDCCSRSEKRPVEYDAWFGIKDGIYARRWKEDE